MQFKYCPNCASLDIERQRNGMDKCMKCNYVGKANEGAMDEINTLKTKLKREGRVPTTYPTQTLSSPEERNEWKEKLKKLKGKSSENAEFL